MEDLWKIRLKKQMTVSQLSSRAGIPARLIRDYEAGKRAIPMQNIEKLARALFVDIMDIEPMSSPIPAELRAQEQDIGPEPQERPRQRRERPTREPSRGPSRRSGGPPSRGASRSRAPAPARKSQLEHMMNLAQLFEWNRKELEEQIGKPLSELTRQDASTALKDLQERIVKERPQKARKRRPYLPESVATFELDYLGEKQEEEELIEFTLFDGTKISGTIIGFGPYNITIEADTEITLNKLAIAYYRVVEGEQE